MSRPRSGNEGGVASMRTDDEKARSSSFAGGQTRLGGLTVTTDLTYSHRTLDEEVHLRSHEEMTFPAREVDEVDTRPSMEIPETFPMSRREEGDGEESADVVGAGRAFPLSLSGVNGSDGGADGDHPDAKSDAKGSHSAGPYDRASTMWSQPSGPIKVGVSRQARDYKMNHPQRGKALVFNNKVFHRDLDLSVRNGTDQDRDRLVHTLGLLGFEIHVFNDKAFKQIREIIDNVAMENHQHYDCLAVCFLSHGENGLLYAYDQPFKPDRIWGAFTADVCPTLAGKPKLFFVQACQGKGLDEGVTLMSNRTETDSRHDTDSYRIPIHADFLITYSTVPGFFSWRNTSCGSWFIQALCDVLLKHSRDEDLLTMMTEVSRQVAFDYESNVPGNATMHRKKQVPFLTSTLTRRVFFNPVQRGSITPSGMA